MVKLRLLFEQKQPEYLYHATYKPLLKSIMVYGLDSAKRKKKNWEDSVEGVIYLATDPGEAQSYAETSDFVPESFLDNIVILKIDTSKIDKTKIFNDKNVIDGDTLQYHGIIQPNAISIYRK